MQARLLHKKIVILLAVLIAILLALAVFIAIRLQQDTTPPDDSVEDFQDCSINDYGANCFQLVGAGCAAFDLKRWTKNCQWDCCPVGGESCTYDCGSLSTGKAYEGIICPTPGYGQCQQVDIITPAGERGKCSCNFTSATTTSRTATATDSGRTTTSTPHSDTTPSTSTASTTETTSTSDSTTESSSSNETTTSSTASTSTDTATTSIATTSDISSVTTTNSVVTSPPVVDPLPDTALFDNGEWPLVLGCILLVAGIILNRYPQVLASTGIARRFNTTFDKLVAGLEPGSFDRKVQTRQNLRVKEKAKDVNN